MAIRGKRFLTREQLVELKDRLNPDVVSAEYFSRILSELPQKPVWYSSEIPAHGKSLSICMACRELYPITPSKDVLLLEPKQTGENIPIPYCERDGLKVMKKSSDTR